MKKELTFKHKLIYRMPMKLLMFLIEEEALGVFVDNIIKLTYRSREDIIKNVLYLDILNAFFWTLDRRTYIVDGKEIDGVKYWTDINEKYRKRVL